MARKTIEVRISDGTPETNRDHGKVFLITEMSAYAAERWAADAFQGLASAGVDLPDDLPGAGIVGLAQIGLKALGGMKPETLHDLLDRMMPCITHYPDPARREVSRQPSEHMNDIEEVSTLLTLRRAVLELHAGFLGAGAASRASASASTTAPSP